MKDMRTETPSVTEEMVRRLNAGEIDAFNDIYHATYVYLCCVAAYYVHSRQAATSVVNDVFLAFWDHRRDIRYPPLPYLRRAVRNQSVSYLRSSLFKEEMSTVHEEAAWDFLENHLLSSDNPLQDIENNEMWGIISGVVESLPSRCREVFKRCLFEGKTYSEVAEEMGISASTARVHLRNAVNRLREELDAPLFVALLLLIW